MVDDLYQLIAVVERIGADSGQAIGKRDAGEGGAVIERVAVYNGYAFGNDEIGNKLAIYIKLFRAVYRIGFTVFKINRTPFLYVCYIYSLNISAEIKCVCTDGE